jgi:hypothetical protein
MRSNLKNIQSQAEDLAQVEECLLGRCKTLSLNPSTA